MGQISEKLDVEMAKLIGLTAPTTTIMVPGAGFTTGPHGGPVIGMAMANSPNLDMQIRAIVNCIQAITVAIQGLEDRK